MKDLRKVSKYFFYLISVCYATEGIVEVLVGSAWPIIAKTINADISLIGILIMVDYIGSAITCFHAYKIRQKIGTNYTMVLSMLCLLVSLVIFAKAFNFYILLIGMFINGLGIGLVEVNASSYVLKAYDAKEESFLFAFWGIGSVIGSTIMAIVIKYYPPYRNAFNAVIIVLIINIILLLKAKISWTKQKETLDKEIVDQHSVTEEEKRVKIKVSDLIKDKKKLYILLNNFLMQGVIITIYSIVATVVVRQGKMSETMGVEIARAYFVALFLGRIIFGKLIKRKNIMKVLKICTIIEAIILVLLYMNILNKYLLCVFIIILGFTISPLIPFVNSYLKEMCDTKILSAVLGYCDVSALVGITVISGLTTLVIKYFSINNVELVFAIIAFVTHFLFVKIEKINK